MVKNMLRRSIYILFLLLTACGYEQKKTQFTWTEPITGMEFVQIPKGHFYMGKAGSVDSLHKVNISHDFWLGRTEVTQEQWQEIMGTVELHPEKPSPFHLKDPLYPKVSISYNDIQGFLEKLNTLSKTDHFRLPTEAEWEYACRAGTSTPFSFGERISDSLASYNADIASDYSAKGKYVEHPMPVGSYPPNSWGLYDMHGNVWEWVSDWYAPYPVTEVTDPIGPSEGISKIIRGGSWYYGAGNALSSTRREHEPQLWGFSIGFRVVRKKK
ncbi:SUMF1/EgtB/PvdO family nonheme iron enzyme [Leptobacterium flavescens]|uniref:SUMF1/EgtB/PvdO family nonheme iron enzyme n=1 Tax=Leptobacterium flavescens TaxID=472055 RepID=A0A6P0UR85_9FLAO|nr:formylglycine-generating enzyme family protein [Leptobacterium flavescens]NER15042.1 SUMF1/EgtB/PvdO family nonheme iron enzyme [Leptobacterium flavescens]